MQWLLLLYDDQMGAADDKEAGSCLGLRWLHISSPGGVVSKTRLLTNLMKGCTTKETWIYNVGEILKQASVVAGESPGRQGQ